MEGSSIAASIRIRPPQRGHSRSEDIPDLVRLHEALQWRGKTRGSCTIRGSFRDVAFRVLCQIARGPAGRAAFSPDGRWLAYELNEIKNPQVWVQPFPNTTGTRYPIFEYGYIHSGRR